MNRRLPEVLPYVLPLIVFLVYGLLAGAGCRQDDTETPAAAPVDPEVAALAPDTVNVVENVNFVEEPELVGWVSAITLNVRSEPGSGAEVVGYVFKGDRVVIFEERPVGGNVWYRINDDAGYVDGWVYGPYISGEPVPSDFIIPDSYKEPRTPTVVTGISAQYVGAKACQRCHSQAHAEFRNGAYGVWVNHFHADAFRTLARPYTKALAARRGVENPETDWRCVKCHVTAYGVPAARRGAGYSDAEGVTCEACHGPGGDYLNDHWEGTPGFAQREANGFRVFRDLDARDAMCRACHNRLSPTYKPFNVAAFSDAIRHWEEKFQIREVATEAHVAAVKPKAPPPAAPAPDPIPPTLYEPPPVITEEEAPALQPVEVPPPAQTPPPPAQTPPPQAPPQTQPTPTPEPPQPAPEPEPEPPPVAEPEPEPEPAPAPAPPVQKVRRGPEEMMLNRTGRRGQVFFPHHVHFQIESGARQCQVCHHTTEPGLTPEPCGSCHKVDSIDPPERKKAFHESCIPCHRELGAGPTKCSECHAR